ncbi:hypothetical protein Celaphus_00003259 [Cervus elaphus hippelaphus]|uniref:Uncharacterized protein n=1 Tax=Cervus elaphus hippelaphus TaxID=46360 RepID=A0A212D2D1_CEREH|nr:hypothetical protein Celaphus_00003259 [Cervus elaphus hippelaphus]
MNAWIPRPALRKPSALTLREATSAPVNLDINQATGRYVFVVPE